MDIRSEAQMYPNLNAHKEGIESQFPNMTFNESSSDFGEVAAGATPLNLTTINLGEDELRPVLANMTRFNHKAATPYLKTESALGPNDKLDELSRQVLLHFQRIQEQRVVLCVGGKRFNTSKVTLRADPNSFFSKMLREDSPMRPYNTNEYFIDRNPAHFNLILDYLMEGAHIDTALLPSEKKYLLELLKEARFYMHGRLQEIVQERLSQVTRSDECY
ncbi:MAG: BTB/POZ domain-containing protein [Candidatus Thiodiazotropha sp.]